MIPETQKERALFVPLSLAAGVSEELAFRGFVPWMLVPWLGSYLLAAGVGAVAFGFLHAYQDTHGVWRTGLMGFVFA
ncbi:MAG: CPBP family intramembrane metalloprotease, partial [Thermoplasmata archaeon]|nr:CPBP family intramembrane metalloprotease [Thermoplasmata archaeon]NIU47814.1 CPBP family intramembrane metalloprotease [Thermoplasmata archaeon]NIV77460.1 CPBP family intramembrane metalloprotease [Thermoplasmata archaeon]